VDPNWHADGCQTALISASDLGHIACVRLLLKAGACTFFCNTAGSTALDRACDRGHVEIVRALVEAGAARDSWGKVGQEAATALSHACDKGHAEIVRILFEAGVDKASLGTALTLACYRGHGEIARVLVDAGAQKDLTIRIPHVLPNAVANKEVNNGDEKAALIHACLSGHVKILFVEAAAKLDSKNRMGFTALIWARRKSPVEIVRVLADAAGWQGCQKQHRQHSSHACMSSRPLWRCSSASGSCSSKGFGEPVGPHSSSVGLGILGSWC